MSQCPSSGTLLHFLSFGTNGDIDGDSDSDTLDENDANGQLSLLAITPSISSSSPQDNINNNNDDDVEISIEKSIQSARNFVSDQIQQSQQSRTIGYKLALLQFLGKPITVYHLLGSNATSERVIYAPGNIYIQNLVIGMYMSHNSFPVETFFVSKYVELIFFRNNPENICFT